MANNTQDKAVVIIDRATRWLQGRTSCPPLLLTCSRLVSSVSFHKPVKSWASSLSLLTSQREASSVPMLLPTCIMHRWKRRRRR